MGDLLRLKCPHCGGSLEGANNSLVFFCHPCSRGLEAEESQLTSFPLSRASPPRHLSPEAVYFPFWRISSEFLIQGVAAPRESDPQGNGGIRISLVPAFFIKSINYFGDIGFYYTRKRIDPQPDEERRPWPVFPADRNLKNALAYPAIYIYRELSQSRDVEKVSIQLQHREFALRLVPFFKVNEKFVDPFILWKYPSGALV